MSLGFRSLVGEAIAEVVDDLARLRIAVFRDWPYLYDGDLDYERRYLSGHAAGAAMAVVARDGERVVGAATGMPLIQYELHLSTDLAALGLDPAETFYCAESVLLPRHRGQGAGHVFFDLREDHARSLGCTNAIFAAVERPADHPARPPAYRPLDPFWRARGYAPLDGVRSAIAWRDLGEAEETEKSLQVWGKRL